MAAVALKHWHPQHICGVFRDSSYARAGTPSPGACEMGRTENIMFADSLLESGQSRQSHRCVAACVSFSAQAIAVGMLLSLSLMYTGTLPPVRVAEPPFTVSMADYMPLTVADPGASAPAAQNSSAIVYRDTQHAHIIHPASLHPGGNLAENGAVGPGTAMPSIIGVGTPGSTQALPGFLTPTPVMPQPQQIEPGKRPDMSNLMESQLIYRVEPEYPVLAAKTRTHGEVVLQAIISPEGTVEDVRVISGHPMLAAAAVRAVREWRYRPCVLNGKPVEVEARVVVRFTLTE